MDSKSEDQIVRQIEKNLSNNMNDNLFFTGKAVEKDRTKRDKATQEIENTTGWNVTTHLDKKIDPRVEHKNQSSSSEKEVPSSEVTYLTRAEYIREARQACLRQLSTMQDSSSYYHGLDSVSLDTSSDLLNQKKAKAMNLFHSYDRNYGGKKEDATPQEIASFRYLIIRTVVAIVLFLSIFIIDRFDIKIGSFASSTIEEYVTGNDTMQRLEETIVTLLKKDK